MSTRDVRDDSLASPLRARFLLTVRAAISLDFLDERPCSFSLSTMCSYCRSRLALHASWGITSLLGRLSESCPGTRLLGLLGPLLLDVVLGRVRIQERRHELGPL